VRQFSVVRLGAAVGVVVDSDLLPKDQSVVVIPLVEGLPRAWALNPIINVAGRPRVLHTRATAAVRADALTAANESLSGDRDSTCGRWTF
jgi:hypothetical protein